MAEGVFVRVRAPQQPLAFRGPIQVLRTLRRWPVVAIIPIIFVIAGLLAPTIAPHSPTRQFLRESLTPPVWQEGGTTRFILGTDHVGRDILSRILYGARISMLVAGTALISGFVVGMVLGLVSGYFGRHIDEVVMRAVDVWLALPFLLIALIVNVTLGTTLPVLLGLLALLAWSAFVRNIRAEVLSIKERDYVALARISGASHLRILVRHIQPQVINTAVVIATLQVGNLILAEASLSFLGAGLSAPTPAWGLMVHEGRNYLETAWWAATIPGFAIFLIVMSLNFTGDWLRDRFDPRLRQL